MPRLAILVIVALPGAAPRGQDVEATPLSAHVIQLLAIMTRDDWILVTRVSLRGLRGLVLGQTGHWGGTNLAAGQGVWSDSFTDQTRRQPRTFLFVAVHCQGFLLNMQALD